MCSSPTGLPRICEDVHLYVCVPPWKESGERSRMQRRPLCLSRHTCVCLVSCWWYQTLPISFLFLVSPPPKGGCGWRLCGVPLLSGILRLTFYSSFLCPLSLFCLDLLLALSVLSYLCRDGLCGFDVKKGLYNMIKVLKYAFVHDSLMVLRWPYAAGRMLKSNYCLANCVIVFVLLYL